VTIVTEEPDVSISPRNNYTFTRFKNRFDVTVNSPKVGLFWTTFDLKSQDEKVEPMKDQLLFFYSKGNNNKPSTLLSHNNKQCHLLKVEAHSCNTISLSLTSTTAWQPRRSSLFSTAGMMFINIGHTAFPVAISKIRATQVLQDFVAYASVKIDTPDSNQCKENNLTPDQLNYAVKNDYFAKEFIAQFNKITPSWFSLDLTQELKYIHEENVRAYVWPAYRVKQHSVCSSAAIDDTSMFLVYLQHETVTMKVHDKSITMNTKSKFCLLIDLCKKEPHLALPVDNFGQLETIFSFSTLQNMGWKISLKSVGFRSGVKGDIRRCSKAGVDQVMFGSAVMSYHDNKNTIKGEVNGLLTYDLYTKNGKQVCNYGNNKIRFHLQLL